MPKKTLIILFTTVFMLMQSGLIMAGPDDTATKQQMTTAQTQARQADQELYESERYKLSPDPVAMLADGLIVRPLGIVSLIVGSVGYAVTLPFSSAAGNREEVRQQLVGYPAWFTFQRKMGHFRPRMHATGNIVSSGKLGTVPEGSQMDVPANRKGPATGNITETGLSASPVSGGNR